MEEEDVEFVSRTAISHLAVIPLMDFTVQSYYQSDRI
jgi:hypothetical protein